MRTIVASYDYTTVDGALLYQVVRYAPKDFRQRKPDGSGGWIWRLGDIERVLCMLPALVNDDGDRPVFLVEGEKDADAIARLGHLATTCRKAPASSPRSQSARARCSPAATSL
ncbi:hypothetical protein BH09MYX1_BH09MYX1_67700 [soil metagenome]